MRRDERYTNQKVRATFKERFGKLTEGQSEDEIAEQIGICIYGVRLWRYQMPYVHELLQIADAYGVTTDYLLGRTEEKEPAAAEAGQAHKEKYNTNNIAQSEEVVKNFTLLPSVLIEFAHSLFGADIEIQHIYARDVATDPKKLVEVEFTAAGEKCFIQVKKGEDQLC